ncbi:MAG: SufD family Fe-S cluster assembly protein [Patescibacteria group bacterium]
MNLTEKNRVVVELESQDENPVVQVPRKTSLTWISVRKVGAEESLKTKRVFVVEEGAELNHYVLFWGEGKLEEKNVIELEGDDSKAFSQTLLFSSGKAEHKIEQEMVHKGVRTHSQTIAKSALKDSARAHFFANIRMEQASNDAEGSLTEHVLLLSPDARIEALPGLEIHHHNVRSSHAAKLERVDSEKLFYLSSRGLNEEQAMQLLLEGFFLEALQRIPEKTEADLPLQSFMENIQC